MQSRTAWTVGAVLGAATLFAIVMTVSRQPAPASAAGQDSAAAETAAAAAQIPGASKASAQASGSAAQAQRRPTTLRVAGDGCIFTSVGGLELRVYTDTRIGDEGDLLDSYRLAPKQATELVARPGDSSFVRVRYRASRDQPWQDGGKQPCTAGQTIQLP